MKILTILAVLLIAVQGFAQPDMIRVYGTVYDYGTNPATGKANYPITVTEVIKNGVLIPYYQNKVYKTNSSGYVYFYLPQTCTAKIRADIYGFDGSTVLSIPAADSVDLASLQPSSTVASTSAGFITIKESDGSPSYTVQGNNDSLLVIGATLSQSGNAITMTMDSAIDTTDYYDEMVSKGQFNRINFTGAGVVITADGDTLDVTITSASADSEYVKVLLDSLDNLNNKATTNIEVRDSLYVWGLLEGSILTEGGTGVYNITESDAAYQPLDTAELSSIAGLTSAANRGIYYTGSGTASLFTLTATGRSILDDASTGAVLTTLGLTANGQSLVTAANYPTMRTLLDLEAGTDFYSIAAADAAFQPLDADLTTLSGPTNWRVFYSNGSAVITELALGSDGTYLRSNGVSSAPTFDTPAGSGDMLKANIPDSVTAQFDWRSEEATPAAGDTFLLRVNGVVKRADIGDLPSVAKWNETGGGTPHYLKPVNEDVRLTLEATNGTDSLNIFVTNGEAQITTGGNIPLWIDPDSGAVYFGAADDTGDPNQVHIYDAHTGDPGTIVLWKDDSTPHYVFFRTSGEMAHHSSYPSNDDSDGTTMETDTHASEHQDSGADEIAVTAGMMNAGTGASSSTYWRGDNTWQTPPVSSADSTFIWLKIHDTDSDSVIIKPSGFSATNSEAAGTIAFQLKDASTNLVSIDTTGNLRVNGKIGVDTDPSTRLHILGTEITAPIIQFENTNNGTAGPTLIFNHNTSSPASELDLISNTTYRGRDDGANETDYLEIDVFTESVVNGSEGGFYEINMQTDGLLSSWLIFDSYYNDDVTQGVFEINHDDRNIDLMWKSDTGDTTLYGDATNSRIGIGISNPDSVLHVDGGVKVGTGINAAGTIEGAILTEGGNAVYNSSETPGGELGGTWASPTLDHDALDDQYYDSEGDLTALLDDNYEAELDNSTGLRAALSDETGTGVSVFGTSPTFTTSILMNAATIDFNEVPSTPSSPPASTTRVYAIDDNGFTVLETLTDLGIVFRINQDTYRIIRNTQGSSITKGQVVYVDGGTATRTNVKLARSDVEATMPAIGVVTATIVDDGYGAVMVVGKMTGLKTDYAGWDEGDLLYVDPTTAGALTATRPTHPNLSQAIGLIEFKDASNGRICVNVANGATGIEDGTNRNTYTIGDQGAGTKSLIFDGTNNGTFSYVSGIGGNFTLDDTLVVTGNVNATKVAATTLVGALTGNASTATLAATVTYADNENTAETNAVVFLPGGDLDGGDLAPEVDGDFTYNPSTGTVEATAFTEGGNEVYNSTETPGGVLGNTWASPTLDADAVDEAQIADYAVTKARFGFYHMPKTITFPDTLKSAAQDTIWFWRNPFGTTITTDSIYVESDVDNYDISLIKSDLNGSNPAVVDAVQATTNGGNHYYTMDTSIVAGSITNGQRIGVLLTTDNANYVTIIPYWSW